MVRVSSPHLPDGLGRIVDYLHDYHDADAARLRNIADVYEHWQNHRTFAEDLRLVAKHREWLDNNAPGWTIYEATQYYFSNPHVEVKVRMIEFPDDNAALLYKLSF